MAKPSNVKKPPESLLRMNFLHKAAESVSGTCNIIAANFGGQIKQISQKSQVKVDRSIKRKLCKGCNNLLKANVTADVKIFGKHRSQKKVGLTCHICRTRRAFLLAEPRKVDRTEKRERRKKAKEIRDKIKKK